ncbi:polysaccharide pyruvyl transferase family protein [Enterococcus avium]|uniref:polysaccharide pyruvyl transferase family protein n=1 Tax=Enterococcus avium TaxID=33945 RepID=UPI0025B216A9|nr:polysaccharide pyruvyl transferase family protein [Enterococcus avium]MDN2638841.1 polysaccharide pyruvyl transferase family protein [Enterococcus avium]
MKATLVSFIDSSNIGDRLIAETLSEQLLTGIEIKKYSYKLIEESQVKINKNLVRRSKPHDIYYKYFRQLPLIKNVVSKGKWIRSRRRMYDSEDIQRFEAALQQSDFLMIGGGNAIFDLSPATLSAQRFDQVVSLAKQHQLPIFVSSIGIGPFSTKKQQNAAIATLKKCDFVSFRDKRSLEYLKNAGHPAAYASVDPVFLLPEVETFEQLKAQKKLQQRIGICVIDYRITGCSRKDYLNYLKDMKNLIHDLATAKKEIILFSSEVQDYETIETLYADFLKEPQVNVVFVKEKEDLLALYQSLNLVIGTRMHSMIVAVSQFVPIIGLSWQQKVVEMFKNLGIEEDVLAIADLSKKREILSKKIDEKLENTDQELIEMRRHKEEMRRAFAINYEIIDTLQQHLVNV